MGSKTNGRLMLTSQRKYTAFWAAFLMASIMLAFNKLTGGEWVTFVSLVYGTYMAGNVVAARSKSNVVSA